MGLAGVVLVHNKDETAVVAVAAWCLLGLLYTAIKTRGFRTPPKMIDLSGA